MTDLVYIPDFRDTAKRLLLSQYRESPRVQALVRACAGAAQKVEDIGFDFLVSTTLSAASGWVLDQWGVIVGESRGALDDTDYRRFLQARILANLSEGTTDDLIEVFEIVAGPGDVRQYDLYPAALALAVYREEPLSDAIRARIRAIMDDIRPAGVGLTLIEGTTNPYQYDEGAGLDSGEFTRVL